MKAVLKYFTGTGNSLRVLDTCKDVFVQHGYNVDISSITAARKVTGKIDLIGFCFPVYAFAIPRICREYLKSLPTREERTRTFLLVTAGDSDEAGFSIKEGKRLLEERNFDVIYTAVVQMPANWITGMNPPAKEKAQAMIDKGVEQARGIASDILNGIQSQHTFNAPHKFSKLRFYRDYYLFRYLGINNLWRLFTTNERCNSCNLCCEICPTRSIKMINGRPKWYSTCEQCMRCVNYCKQEAIYQTFGGGTEGKNRYMEPTFKPLKTARQNRE